MVVRCKFIALPLLDDEDVYQLLEKNFYSQFSINNYHLLEKIRRKLLYMELYEDRDEFKEKLKKRLLESEANFIEKDDKRSISDWLKDYNRNVGTGKADSLDKNEYISQLNRKYQFSEAELRKIRLLIDLYEKLKVSSMEMEGFEEEVLLKQDNKLKLFKQGNLETISTQEDEKTGQKKKEDRGKVERQKSKGKEEQKKWRAEASATAGGSKETDKNEEKTELEDNKNLNKKQKRSSKPEIRLEKLKRIKNNYEQGSLERKAIESEIRELEK
jgi:trichohyalin